VWEFTTEKGERNETTRLLSNDVEDILSSYAACKVVQRSRFAKLQEQINNEKAVQSLNSASAASKAEFKATQAKRVIFGEVNRDFTGNVSLRLSFENLVSTQLRSNTVFLIGEEYYNFEKRKQKLTALVNAFINPDGKLPVPGGTGGGGTTTGECSRDNMPFQKEFAPFGQTSRVELCQCYFYNKKITCPLIVKNLTEYPFGFYLEVNGKNYGRGISRIVIDYGTEYTASQGKLMSVSSDISAQVDLPVTKYGVPARLVFDVPSTQSKLIESIEISCITGQNGWKAVFQDIPLVHGPPPAR
jgi:hypothetical protein